MRKLTIQEVEVRYPDIVHGQKWLGNHAVYRFMCEVHGVYFQNFGDHKGCPNCNHVKGAATHKLTIQEAETRYPDMVRGQTWTTNNAKYWFVCKLHGKYRQRFDNHSVGKRCKKCACSKRGVAIRRTIREVEEQHSDLVKGQSWCATEKYRYLCNVHGEYVQSFSKHSSGQGCPLCGKMRTAACLSLCIKEAEKRHPDLIRGQRWAGNSTKYKYKCKRHGEYWQSFASHDRCPECNIKKAFRSRRLKIKSVEKRQPDFIRGQRWRGSSAKYLYRCVVHKLYQQVFNSHHNGRRCPFCNESKGEREIALYLDKNKYAYERQKTFETCRATNLLFFDFCVPSLDILIEFQGAQHYRPVKWFGGKKGLLRRVARDKIKREWALANGYKLVEVPYWCAGSIIKKLDKEFSELRMKKRDVKTPQFGVAA